MKPPLLTRVPKSWKRKGNRITVPDYQKCKKELDEFCRSNRLGYEVYVRQDKAVIIVD